MKQKSITAKKLQAILEAITAEEYEEAMNLCELWKISPREWRFILHNDTQTPEVLSMVINTKREERKAK